MSLIQILTTLVISFESFLRLSFPIFMYFLQLLFCILMFLRFPYSAKQVLLESLSRVLIPVVTWRSKNRKQKHPPMVRNLFFIQRGSRPGWRYVTGTSGLGCCSTPTVSVPLQSRMIAIATERAVFMLKPDWSESLTFWCAHSSCTIVPSCLLWRHKSLYKGLSHQNWDIHLLLQDHRKYMYFIMFAWIILVKLARTITRHVAKLKRIRWGICPCIAWHMPSTVLSAPYT